MAAVTGLAPPIQGTTANVNAAPTPAGGSPAHDSYWSHSTCDWQMLPSLVVSFSVIGIAAAVFTGSLFLASGIFLAGMATLLVLSGVQNGGDAQNAGSAQGQVREAAARIRAQEGPLALGPADGVLAELRNEVQGCRRDVEAMRVVTSGIVHERETDRADLRNLTGTLNRLVERLAPPAPAPVAEPVAPPAAAPAPIPAPAVPEPAPVMLIDFTEGFGLPAAAPAPPHADTDLLDLLFAPAAQLSAAAVTRAPAAPTLLDEPWLYFMAAPAPQHAAAPAVLLGGFELADLQDMLPLVRPGAYVPAQVERTDAAAMLADALPTAAPAARASPVHAAPLPADPLALTAALAFTLPAAAPQQLAAPASAARPPVADVAADWLPQAAPAAAAPALSQLARPPVEGVAADWLPQAAPAAAAPAQSQVARPSVEELAADWLPQAAPAVQAEGRRPVPSLTYADLLDMLPSAAPIQRGSPGPVRMPVEDVFMGAGLPAALPMRMASAPVPAAAPNPATLGAAILAAEIPGQMAPAPVPAAAPNPAILGAAIPATTPGQMAPAPTPAAAPNPATLGAAIPATTPGQRSSAPVAPDAGALSTAVPAAAPGQMPLAPVPVVFDGAIYLADGPSTIYPPTMVQSAMGIPSTGPQPNPFGLLQAGLTPDEMQLALAVSLSMQDQSDVVQGPPVALAAMQMSMRASGTSGSVAAAQHPDLSTSMCVAAGGSAAPASPANPRRTGMEPGQGGLIPIALPGAATEASGRKRR